MYYSLCCNYILTIILLKKTANKISAWNHAQETCSCSVENAALLWEDDGFLLLYKRLDNGSFQWSGNDSETKLLTPVYLLK